MNSTFRRVSTAFVTMSAIVAAGQATVHALADTQHVPSVSTSVLQGFRTPVSTPGQDNAIRTAQDYLEISAFSRSGLIEQLEYEKYSEADSIYAVDHIMVDWYEQAAKAAKDYLAVDSFSHQGLVDQLEYEGFTPGQAEYGVTAVGL